MKTVDLLAIYERAADSPDAVEKLRRFVLELAVRGKLVEQDNSDESAAALLTRLSASKASRTKSGALKTPLVREASPDQLTNQYPLPATWLWVRLEDVGAIAGGGTPPSTDPDNFAQVGKGIPWLTPADLGKYRSLFIERGARDLSPKGLEVSSATMLPAGSVLFTSRAPIGYVAIASNPLATNQGFKSVVPYLDECSRYVALVLRAFAPLIAANAPGTTFKEVSAKIVAGISFPLAPLAEQHRIVAKVDELMALCDQLEAARKEREAARDRLAAASLARLNAPDPDTFQADGRFALNALPALSARRDQVKQLRQTILNLAVRGKLVAQRPEDTQNGEILKPTDVERSGRLNLQLPNGWTWARVEDVGSARLGKMLDRTKNRGRPFRYLGNANVHWFDIRSENLKEILLDEDEVSTFLLEPNDVLICEGGHGIGRTAVWRGADTPVVFQKALHRVRPGAHLNADYFAACCYVYFDNGIMQSYFTGVGIPHFTGKALAQLEFPLPPLEEQQRIVAKMDELMSLCDRLDESLVARDEARGHLLNELLHATLQSVNH